MEEMKNNALAEEATAVELEPVKKKNIWKFVLASVIGAFLFLVPIPNGTTFTIPIGMVIDWVASLLELETINLASLLVVVFITFSTIVTIINMIFKPAIIQNNESMKKLFSPTPPLFCQQIDRIGRRLYGLLQCRSGDDQVWRYRRIYAGRIDDVDFSSHVHRLPDAAADGFRHHGICWRVD